MQNKDEKKLGSSSTFWIGLIFFIFMSYQTIRYFLGYSIMLPGFGGGMRISKEYGGLPVALGLILVDIFTAWMVLGALKSKK